MSAHLRVVGILPIHSMPEMAESPHGTACDDKDNYYIVNSLYYFLIHFA